MRNDRVAIGLSGAALAAYEDDPAITLCRDLASPLEARWPSLEMFP